MKKSTTIHQKANQFLRLEEENITEGKPIDGQSKEVIQSNVAVKKDGNIPKTATRNEGKTANQKKWNHNAARHNGDRKYPRNMRPKDCTLLNDSLENIYLSTEGTEQYNKHPKKEATEKQK